MNKNLSNWLIALSCCITFAIDMHGQNEIFKSGYYKGHKWVIYYFDPNLEIDGAIKWSICRNALTVDELNIGDELFFYVTSKSEGHKNELYDFDGNLIIPYQFDHGVGVNKFGSTYLLTVNKKDVWNPLLDVFSTKGQLVLPDCREISYITKDKQYGEIFKAKVEDGYGVFNTGGVVIVPPGKYKDIKWTMDEDNNIVTFEFTNTDDYIGMMDRNKNWLVPFNRQFKTVKPLETEYGRYFLCQKNNNLGKYALFNDKWNEVLTPNYSSITPLDVDGVLYFKVYKDGYCGLYDKTGTEIFSPDYGNLWHLGSNYWGFQINGYCGVMTMQGKVIIPTSRRYTSIGRFIKSQKRFTYSMDGFEGECNHLGQQVSKRRVAKPKSSTTTTSPSKTSSSSSSAASSRTSSTSSSTTSNSASTSNNNSGNNTTTIHVEHHHDPVPVQQWQACWACGGMGTMGCDGCGGSGTKYIGNRLHRCGLCNGSGIRPCNICYGNKGQYITVYK